MTGLFFLLSFLFLVAAGVCGGYCVQCAEDPLGRGGNRWLWAIGGVAGFAVASIASLVIALSRLL